MHIAAVLKRKGSHVVSIAPDRTIAEAVSLLTKNGIGAVLVLDSSGDIHGILSERDIVNGLSGQGADALRVCSQTGHAGRCFPGCYFEVNGG
jgi:CBS domain-containing protein